MEKPLIRVTQLEAFRRYMQQSENARYEITEQSVIDSITSAFEGNAYTRIGTAFHSIVETGHPVCEKLPADVRYTRRLNTETRHYEEVKEQIPAGRMFNVEGFCVSLDVNQIKVALQYRAEHPDAIHEHRLYKDFGVAVVTGQMDMIDGLEIRDIKTKYSQPNDEDYIKSCQSHFYMEMCGLDTFHYDLFIFEGYDINRNGYDVRGLPLYRHEPITVYAYPEMASENHRLLASFLEWADARNLMQYLHKRPI